MAGPFYVDPSDGGSDSGTEANPWTSLQSAADTAVAGEIIYCRNTQTLTAAIDFDTNAGGTASGRVLIIGCPTGSWVPDGTRFVLDGNSAAAECMTIAVAYLEFRNIESKNATGSGIDPTSAGDDILWNNCISHNNGSHGWDTAGDRTVYLRCASYSNGGDAWTSALSGTVWLWCSAWDNTDDGILGSGTSCFVIQCATDDNGGSAGDRGIVLDRTSLAYNCVANGEIIGVQCVDIASMVIACRLTNNATGLDFTASADNSIYGWNVFHNSSVADIADASVGTNAIPFLADTDTNEIDQDADDGYANAATKDFNLKASRTYNGTTDYTVGLIIGA